MTDEPLLKIVSLSKAFGATQALKDVSFEVKPSSFHSLVGENGAGKSTLINCLMGNVVPDEGNFELLGTPYMAEGPLEANEHGIAAVYQEPSVAGELTVAENLLMGSLPTQSGMVNRKLTNSKAQSLIDNFGIDLDAKIIAEEISASHRVLLGLVRALSDKPKLLICDEPTAHFSPDQAETLFALLRNFIDQGNSVLYISHRLEEVLEQSDQITILRDGQHVETVPAKGLNERELIKRMVGRYQENLYPQLSPPKDIPRLEIKTVNGDGNLNITVNRGEIVGIYGLVGAGRTDFLRSVFGDLGRQSLEVKIDGKNLVADRPDLAISDGLAIIPEDRRNDGLSSDRPIVDNTSLAALGSFVSRGLVNRKAERKTVRNSLEKYGVKYNRMGDFIDSLSGGNQQKVVFAKWALTDPKVYLLDEPTVGVDIGAKEAIYNHIKELAEQGVAILLVSSYLPEVIGMSHRVLVMRDGDLVEDNKTQINSEHKYVEMASGVTG